MGELRLCLWDMHTSLSFHVNEISRNKVVAPEGVAGLKLIISFLLVQFSLTLNYYVVRFGMI